MHSYPIPEYGLWLESGLVLAVGTAVIVAMAAVASRWTRRAVWQRTIWQAATLGLFALLVVELTGAAGTLIRVVASERARAAAKSQSAGLENHQQGSDVPSDQPLHLVPKLRLGNRLSPASDTPQRELELPEETFPSWSLGARDTPELVPKLQLGNPRQLGNSRQHADRPPPSPATPLNEGSLARIDPLGTASQFQEVSANRAANEDDRCSAGSAAAAVRPPRTDSACWPGVIWLLGALAVAGRIAWARLLLFVFRRRDGPATDEALRRTADRIARRLGIRRPVAVLEGRRLTAPVAFGAFRSALVVPAGFTTEFDRQEQEAMLVHELAHLAARDPAWQLMADLLAAALWWHPLVWWSRRRLRAASETAADEASLLVPAGPEVLASCLVALGRQMAPRDRWCPAWMSIEGSDFRSNLGRRVTRLLDLSAWSGRRPGRATVAFAKTTLPVALVILAVFSTAWARPQADFREGGTRMNVIQTSWRHSLAAAVLMALLAPVSGDAVSDEIAPGPPQPAAVDDLPDAGWLAQRDAGEREEAESREREEGERPSAEQREEAAEREREREQAERREEGRRERDRGESRERDVLREQVEVLETAILALREAERRDAIELVERAIRARKVTLEGRRDDEAHMIREQAPSDGELAETLRAAAGLWREFNNPEKAEIVGRLAEELARARERDERAGRRDREPRPDAERREREARERPEAGRRAWEQYARDFQQKCFELEQKAAEIKLELETLRQKFSDDHPAARQARARLEEIQKQLAEFYKGFYAPRAWGVPEGAPEQVRRAIQERVNQAQELWAEHAEALRAGQRERAEEIRRRVSELFQSREGMPWAQRRVADRPPAREEADRRRMHVEAAIENLRAAGLPELAERIAAEAGRGRRGDQPPRPPADEAVRRAMEFLERAQRDRPAPPAEQMERAVQGLREEVQDLRNQMQEMREALQRIIDRFEERESQQR